MVRNHVHADVHGHDHAPEFDGCGFGKFGVATILKDVETPGSSNTGTGGAGNSELVDSCANCSGDDHAGSIGASSNDAVEISNNSEALKALALQNVLGFFSPLLLRKWRNWQTHHLEGVAP